MLRNVLFASLALVGCGRSEGVPDDKLGTLVVAPKEKVAPIDVARAAKDPGELGRALTTPYAKVIAAIGPHTYSIDTTTLVDEGAKRVTDLSDHATIELGDKGTYHALYTNSADYGREVTFEGGKLYLRPRYQRWHGRAPESPEEPGEQRDSFFGAIAATWDLVAPGAELSDQGQTQVAGRAARKIAVKLSPSPRAASAEPVVQRKWREKRTIEALSGEVTLDAATGAPLAMKLAATVGFSRDGRRFSMKLGIDAKASAIGTAVAVAAPAADQIVATPERRREVDDRDFLLQGIAPPIRKNPDGTAVTPVPAPAPAPAGSNSQK
ncbi:MAG: hypothetical protein HOV81_13195 [Kofleriaceae bacterium]|nr:hypothetical protein [Kofleriaceae bacterium]